MATRWVIPVPTEGILAARLTTSTRARSWSSKGRPSGRQDTAHRITDRCVDDSREPEGKALQVRVQSLAHVRPWHRTTLALVAALALTEPCVRFVKSVGARPAGAKFCPKPGLGLLLELVWATACGVALRVFARGG